jgi:hypothetical protein
MQAISKGPKPIDCPPCMVGQCCRCLGISAVQPTTANLEVLTPKIDGHAMGTGSSVESGFLP